MPRFEMYLMLAEKEDDKVETCEYEMICWVKDSSNIEEIKASANEKINDHIEGAKSIVLFGTASIRVKGEEVINIGFRNSEINPDDIDDVIDLFDLNEETVH